MILKWAAKKIMILALTYIDPSEEFSVAYTSAVVYAKTNAVLIVGFKFHCLVQM